MTSQRRQENAATQSISVCGFGGIKGQGKDEEQSSSPRMDSKQVLVSQTTFSLLHQLNLEGGFSRCWPSNQQAFPNICAINHTEEYSPHIPLAAVLKVVFVRLNLPSESTLSHSLEKPLPPVTTQGTYRDKTQHTPFSSNSDCQILGGE